MSGLQKSIIHSRQSLVTIHSSPDGNQLIQTNHEFSPSVLNSVHVSLLSISEHNHLYKHKLDEKYMIGELVYISRKSYLHDLDETLYLDPNYMSIHEEFKNNQNQYYYFAQHNESLIQNEKRYQYSSSKYTIPSSLRFSFLSLPYHADDRIHDIFNGYSVILFIKTRPDGFDNRQGIRETYGNNSVTSNIIRYFFVLGVNPTQLSLIKDIYDEQAKYNDIIFENIIDSYQNLTLKMMMVEDLYVLSNSQNEFILFTDDDICLNTKKLIHFLEKKKGASLVSSFSSNQMSSSIGMMNNSLSLYGGGCYYLDKNNKNPESLHYIPPFIVKEVYYVFGPLIYTTPAVIQKHVSVMRTIPYWFHVDDVFMGYLTKLISQRISFESSFIISSYEKERYTKIEDKTSNVMALNYVRGYNDYHTICTTVNHL
ncbi:hypothetical protein WA158_002223 [Blastocystis sp. Blastoise]